MLSPIPATKAAGAIIALPLGQSAPDVILEGDGIASVCAARLLTDAGVRCALIAPPRPKLAAILLSEQTRHLLCDLFPQDGGPDLFAGFPRITRRIVLWGQGGSPVDLPHRGIVVAEESLLHRLWQRVPEVRREEGPEGKAIHLRATRSAVTSLDERTFGVRTGRIASVELTVEAAPERCWVESVSAGWLFLLTLSGRTASLIAVGGAVSALLSESRLIRPNVGAILSEGPSIPVYPRLLQTLAGPDWIACGTAAMSFDPLCGEGTGHAIREGFLAAAVLRSALAGTDPELLAQHYTARLRQGMLRHLQACLPFYETGGSTRFWTEEAEALQRGIIDLQVELNHLPPPRFRLADRDLVAT